MATWKRIAVGLANTIALAILGIIYQQVFVETLIPAQTTEGTYSFLITWIDNLVPFIIAILLLTVWAWVIAGAVQEERTRDRRQLRR